MNEWVELLVTYDEIEAQIVKNIIDAEHIPVVIDSSKIRPYPANIGKMGEVKVLVRKEDVEKAREVLKMKIGTLFEKLSFKSNEYIFTEGDPFDTSALICVF